MHKHQIVAVGASSGGSAHESVIAGATQRLRWRINRLRCMTPVEIQHRALRAVTARAERWGLRNSATMPRPDLAQHAHAWIHVTKAVDPARYLMAANRIIAGEFDIFALRCVKLGYLPRWNRDPKTGVEAPLRFGKLLDYRNPRLVGNIKYLWELNRHLHLVTLAQAYAISRDARYCYMIRQHLETWFASCPYLMGPNWSSALESAIRLINWSATWQLLGGAHASIFADAEGARFRRHWLKSVYQHARFIRGHLSLYSSANNHLVGEAAGLYVAALSWPHWSETHGWLAEGAAILEREVQLQNAPDGVNREQAVAYQQFELDLLLAPLLAARANGKTFSRAFESRIEAMIEYLAAIIDAGGNIPMFGDSDDGIALNLSQEYNFCRYRSLLATGALLFGRADFKAKAKRLDDKTRWLLGATADDEFRQLAAAEGPLSAKRVFPDGGYYILGCDFDTDEEIRLVADAGPLGYQSIAAHGHADALAFTLSVGGCEFFIDPGTFAYHSDDAWREYFRGTSAHNTLRVDGLDQSQSGGNFMWLRKAHANCGLWRSSADRDVFEGSHDGYTRLPDPVTHTRRIVLEKQARRIFVADTLLMSGTHDIELFFHCSERCRVALLYDRCAFALDQASKTVILKLPRMSGATVDVYCGCTIPKLGWLSRHFDDRQPSSTIAWRARLSGNVVLRSELIL